MMRKTQCENVRWEGKYWTVVCRAIRSRTPRRETIWWERTGSMPAWKSLCAVLKHSTKCCGFFACVLFVFVFWSVCVCVKGVGGTCVHICVTIIISGVGWFSELCLITFAWIEQLIILNRLWEIVLRYYASGLSF